MICNFSRGMSLGQVGSCWSKGFLFGSRVCSCRILETPALAEGSLFEDFEDICFLLDI